jgi:hypothetical protein
METIDVFSQYIDQFIPHIKKERIVVSHKIHNKVLYFGLKSNILKSRTTTTHFLFYHIDNNYTEPHPDLNCSMELIKELEHYFGDKTKSLLLEWFKNEYDFDFKQIIPTPLIEMF